MKYEKLKRIKRIYSVFSVCLILIGAAHIIRPDMAVEVYGRICGVILILFGVVKLMGYFSRDLLQLAFQYDFAMGIIAALIGLSLTIWPTHLLGTMTIAIGLFMLADALLRIQTAMDARKIGVERWWIILVIALVTAVIGTMLFLRTYMDSAAIARLIGCNLIIDGILNLYVVQSTVTTIRRRMKWED